MDLIDLIDGWMAERRWKRKFDSLCTKYVKSIFSKPPKDPLTTG